MRKFLGFDIEVCSWPEDNNWKAVAPIGVSCIGLMGTDWEEPKVYYAGMFEDAPLPRPMETSELDTCIKHILDYMDHDYILTGWNSLQFDLQCLYEELKFRDSEYAETCKSVAMNHVDPMFEIFCTFGWPVGLDAVAHGIGLPGKMKDGVSGADAPKMWMEGTEEDRNTVLKYVGQDALTSVDVVDVGVRTGKLKWLSKKGRPYSISYIVPRTCRECLELPEKDNSWMTDPIHRSDFYKWTK